MMGTFLSFYFYFFLKAKIQTSALGEFTESFLQYLPAPLAQILLTLAISKLIILHRIYQFHQI